MSLYLVQFCLYFHIPCIFYDDNAFNSFLVPLQSFGFVLNFDIVVEAAVYSFSVCVRSRFGFQLYVRFCFRVIIPTYPHRRLYHFGSFAGGNIGSLVEFASGK